MSEAVDFEPQNFIFETPLYEKVIVNDATAHSFSNLFNKEMVKVDGHCYYCKKSSVFHSSQLFSGHEVSISRLRGIQTAELVCQRNSTHVITIITKMIYSSNDDRQITLIAEKVGQCPSHADIANGGVKDFESILTKEDRSELIRANGLAAHGVNIGAFVYLRRLFERLVWRAFERSTNASNEADFSKLRMDEKIANVADELPRFMSDNRRIYSVLSKGIHQLSENECGKYYELMRRSIFLMLEQEKEIKERKEKEDALDKLVKSIQI